MKKMIIAAGLACTLAFGLTACGGGGSAQNADASKSETAAASGSSADVGSSSAKDDSSAAPDSGAAQSAQGGAAAPAGEEYDVGDFTVTVPSNWMIVPQKDMLEDPDENGEYPTSTDSIALIKDGESEWDVFSKPTIYIYKYEGDAGQQAETTAVFYDETEDLDVTINGVTCPAFEAKTAGLSEDDGMYVYNIVFYPVSDETFFQINVPVDMIDFKGVNLADADVKGILESLKAK